MKNWRYTLRTISTLTLCLFYLLWPQLGRANTEPSSRLTAVVAGSPSNDASIFLPVLNSVANPSIAVDQAGGIHLAFEAVKAKNGRTPILYGYCATNCLLTTNWQIISIGDAGARPDSEVRLALTAAGKPRLLWFYSIDADLHGRYIFASCEQNCTQLANWQGLPVADIQGLPTGGRYFALDGQGNPHFFYTSILDNHTGAFYRYCLNSCLVLQNWREQQINDNFQLSAFSLAFDARNRLRLAVGVGDGRQRALFYLTCDSQCTSIENWQGVRLDPFGTDGNLSLRLDAEGCPRLAVYSGYFGDGQPENFLYYRWCNTDCQQASNWRGVNMGLAESEGGNLDLLLDAQARPHLVITTSASLPQQIDYIYCRTQCESAPVWQRALVETADQLGGTGVRYIGWRPALAWALTGDLLLTYGIQERIVGTDNSTYSIRLVGVRGAQTVDPSPTTQATRQPAPPTDAPTLPATPTPFK